MYEVRLDVLQDSCVVSNQEDAMVIGFLGTYYSFRNDAERINIKTRICLIENGELWLEKLELHDFMALLLAARESFIDISLSK